MLGTTFVLFISDDKGFFLISHFCMKLAGLIDLVMDNILRNCFALFEGFDPKSRLLLICKSTAIYQKPNMMVL